MCDIGCRNLYVAKPVRGNWYAISQSMMSRYTSFHELASRYTDNWSRYRAQKTSAAKRNPPSLRYRNFFALKSPVGWPNFNV